MVSVDLIKVFYLGMELVGGLRELPVLGLHLIFFLSGWAVLRPKKNGVMGMSILLSAQYTDYF